MLELSIYKNYLGRYVKNVDFVFKEFDLIFLGWGRGICILNINYLSVFVIGGLCFMFWKTLVCKVFLKIDVFEFDLMVFFIFNDSIM